MNECFHGIWAVRLDISIRIYCYKKLYKILQISRTISFFSTYNFDFSFHVCSFVTHLSVLSLPKVLSESSNLIIALLLSLVNEKLCVEVEVDECDDELDCGDNKLKLWSCLVKEFVGDDSEVSMRRWWLLSTLTCNFLLSLPTILSWRVKICGKY